MATLLGTLGGGEVIDVRDFGVTADGTTNDTAALQAALDAAVTPVLHGQTGVDRVATIVELPRGRMIVTAPLGITANTVLRGKGPASTYLVSTIPLNGSDGKTDPTIKLKTGAEVQCELRDFGIIASANSDGIHFIQTGGASILGDSRHVIDNVVVVGGSTCLAMSGNTECIVSNFTGQRQAHVAAYRYDGVLYVAGTDHRFDQVTLGQPDSSATEKPAIRNSTANTRFVNVKVFGGGCGGAASGGHAIQGGAGNRNQMVACEVQDYNGSAIDAADVTLGCVADSCAGVALTVSGGVVVRAFLSTKRGGGAYTPAWALNMGNNDDGGVAMADVDMKITGPHTQVMRQGSHSARGHRLKLNSQGGGTYYQSAYAASYTPDPLKGSSHILATLTGNLTLNNPAPEFSQARYHGMELEFVITQDGTGGRTITLGTQYKTTAAIATVASTVTRIKFVYEGASDGTGAAWRETSRSVTT